MAAAINEGLKIPGFKLVEGRSNRVIVSPDAVIEKLHTSGFREDTYLKPQELLGISYLEKNIGKKVFEALCGDYVIKPTGKLSLVPNSDKRIAIDVKTLKLDGSEFAENVENVENVEIKC